MNAKMTKQKIIKVSGKNNNWAYLIAAFEVGVDSGIG
jgi:hypothetical protein